MTTKMNERKIESLGGTRYEGMNNRMKPRLEAVASGTRLALADLPPAGTKRWVTRRKAEVVAAVRGGVISLEDACNRYALTVEEFLSWQYAIDTYGLDGLRVTRVQEYRHAPPAAKQARVPRVVDTSIDRAAATRAWRAYTRDARA